MKIKKVHILGGSGFVGTRLISSLLPDFQVKNLDIRQSYEHADITVIHDVRSFKANDIGLEQSDYVVLLAAEHRDDVSPVSKYYETNVDGTINVLKQMDEVGCKNLIFTSSVAIYGLDKDNPSEEFQPDPFNHYGRSKLEAEDEIRKWYNNDPANKSVTIIRPTVIFGEKNRGNVYNLLSQISSGKFYMIGKGQNRKSMAYVGNVVAFIKNEIFNANKGYEVYNYADKPDFTMTELLNQVRTSLNVHIPKLKIPYVLGLMIGYGFDFISILTKKKYAISSIRIKKFCATTQYDANKAHSNFVAPYTMDEALDNTLKYEFQIKN